MEFYAFCGAGSSSGKALVYGLNGLGSFPAVGGGGDFSSLLCVQTGSGVQSASYKMSTEGLAQGKGSPNVGLVTLLTLPLPGAVAQSASYKMSTGGLPQGKGSPNVGLSFIQRKNKETT